MTKKIKPHRRMTALITILSDPHATVAKATLADMSGGVLEDGGSYVATGAAKKAPGDVYDPVIDVDLAVGRALMKLGGQMILSGNARVRAAEQEQAKKKVNDKFLSGMWLDRPAPRHAKPDVQFTLAEIDREWGKKAAKRAARRRGQTWPPDVKLSP